MAEVALQQQLVALGQLPPPSERPAGMKEFWCCRWSYHPQGAPTPKQRLHHPWVGADWVYVVKGGASKPMTDKYSGPYRVLERGNKAWKLQVGERVEVVSRDRLKPHLGSVAPEGAVAPTHGRPRTASVAPVTSPSLAEKPGGPM